jgi:hypothetical protein
MKKVLFGFAFLLNAVFYFSEIKAQVNLPYTLTFTGNASGWSTTGIAHDGEGGTANINGLDIQIYIPLWLILVLRPVPPLYGMITKPILILPMMITMVLLQGRMKRLPPME